MNAKAELHILMPGACGPLAEVDALKDSPVVDNWIKFLSRSRCQPSAANVHDAVVEIFKLPTEKDIPSAALTMLANHGYDEKMHFMHADPVHLRADLDHAVLTPSMDLAISEQESALLCEALNRHFSQDGLIFIRLNKDQWLVSSDNEIRMKTTPLADATARNINSLLPQGEDAGSWKKILTEAQMLMHAHEINASRENSGQQTVNSLWLHGCGDLPVPAGKKISSVCSDHAMFRGLASHIKSEYLELPGSVDIYIEHLRNSRTGAVNVLHLPSLEHLINYTDVSLWLNELDETLKQWLFPIVKAANINNIETVLYPCNGQKYHPAKYDACKFWIKGNVEQHIGCHKSYVE